MSRRGARAATAAGTALAVLAVGAGTGWAVASARATGSQALATGSWGAQLGPLTGTVQPGSFGFGVGPLVTATTTGRLRSTGTLPVTQQDWTVVVDPVGGTRTLTVEICDGASFNALGVCTGQLTSRGLVDGTTHLFSTALQPAARVVEVRLSTTSNRLLTGTISIAVTRPGAPAARTVTS